MRPRTAHSQPPDPRVAALQATRARHARGAVADGGGARRRSRRLVLTAAGVAVALGLGGPAWAYWSVSAGAEGSATSAALNPPTAVTVTATSTTAVAVRVTGAPAGLTPTGYRVLRGTTEVCQAVAFNAACNDSGLTPGTSYGYTVQSRIGTNWLSAPTATVTGSTGPAAPARPSLLGLDDSGFSATDAITNKTSLRFTGSAPAGSTVTLFSGTATSPFATVAPVPVGGTWTSTAATFTVGSRNITAKVTLNGITSDASQPLVLVIDQASPTSGAVTSVCAASNAFTVTGFCPGSATVTVSNLADTGGAGIQAVTYSIAGGATQNASISGSIATFPVPGPNGTPSVSYTVTDAAGNSITGTHTLSVLIDTAVPVPTNIALANNSGGQGTQGFAGVGDTVTITFSDGGSAGSGVNPSRICSGWSDTSTSQQSVTANNAITVRIVNGSQGVPDSLTVLGTGCPTLNLGQVVLGGDYVQGGNAEFSGNGANASKLTWNYSTSTLVITLGGVSSGSTNLAENSAPSGTPTYSSSNLIKDRAGNGLSGTATGSTPSRF